MDTVAGREAVGDDTRSFGPGVLHSLCQPCRKMQRTQQFSDQALQLPVSNRTKYWRVAGSKKATLVAVA